MPSAWPGNRSGMTDRADFPTLGNRFLIPTEQTDGRFALIEHTLPPRALGAPLHTHTNEDEYSFVLVGRMGAQLGDNFIEAGSGELVMKPRGIPHAFWNPGDEETVILELISPGGFSNYFRDMAPLLNGDGPPDVEAIGAVWAKYRLSMDIESIGPLSERFGLAVPG